jgi:phosphoribosyl 1,2-cyclic phosphate phosphodiesterase
LASTLSRPSLDREAAYVSQTSFHADPPGRATDLAGQLLLLGTGTSVGVPVVGCGCPTCTSTNPRNQRTRSSVILGLPEGNLLVDTTPDLRTQLLRERVGRIHATVYTHDHADHLFGLDDLRIFSFYLGHPMPVWCEERVEARIRKSFDYAFMPELRTYAGGVPQMEIHRLAPGPFHVLGQPMTALRLLHGRLEVLGFRVGNVAYCTDTNSIPPESWSQLAGLDVLILDALRPQPHPTHFSLDEAIAVARQLGAKRTLLTHLSHEVEHEAIGAKLPPGIALAYDGLRVPLT